MTVIGIDLGTSSSAAAVLRRGRPVIIPSSEGFSIGGKAFPSCVALTADGQMLVGEPARRQTAANREGTAKGFKRKMGRRDLVKLRDKTFTPEQLSGFLLQKIKRDAEAFLGEPVSRAVVTVPAYFDDNQRSATKDACRIAGLEVARLVNEPTAASLAYGLDRAGEDLTIAVIDLGGGTLDVTVMELGKGVFEVKATSGDTQLGGTEMDKRMLDDLLERFEEKTGCDLRGNSEAEARVREAAELAKIDLSTSTTTRVSLPFLTSVGANPVHMDLEVTRAQLERLVNPVIERCRRSVTQALEDAHESPSEIDRIVLVGGPTRMPVVRKFFEDLLGRKAEMGVDPMECVASGAAIQAGVLSGEVGDIVPVDVTLPDDAEKLNRADSLCYRADKSRVEHGDKLTADLKSRLDAVVRETREAVEKKDAALVAERTENLRAVMQEMGKVIYQAATQAGARASTGSAPQESAHTTAAAGESGRVVDAEYTNASGE